MQLRLKNNLPFVNLILTHKGESIEVENIVIDTGSATTILASEIMDTIHITPLPEDILYSIRGIGGSEVVFARSLDLIKLGECSIHDFEVEIGGMDYSFDINGILGMDFLLKSRAIIDLQDMKIEFDG